MRARFPQSGNEVYITEGGCSSIACVINKLAENLGFISNSDIPRRHGLDIAVVLPRSSFSFAWRYHSRALGGKSVHYFGRAGREALVGIGEMHTRQ